jgi:hypothetical protein
MAVFEVFLDVAPEKDIILRRLMRKKRREFPAILLLPRS